MFQERQFDILHKKSHVFLLHFLCNYLCRNRIKITIDYNLSKEDISHSNQILTFINICAIYRSCCVQIRILICRV